MPGRRMPEAGAGAENAGAMLGRKRLLGQRSRGRRPERLLGQPERLRSDCPDEGRSD